MISLKLWLLGCANGLHVTRYTISGTIEVDSTNSSRPTGIIVTTQQAVLSTFHGNGLYVIEWK